MVRCLKATSGASGALALPHPLLPEDLTPLNAEPDYSVPVSILKKIRLNTMFKKDIKHVEHLFELFSVHRFEYFFDFSG